MLFVLFLFLQSFFSLTPPLSLLVNYVFSMRTLCNFVLLLLLSPLCEMTFFLKLYASVSLISTFCLVLDPNFNTNLILPLINTSYYVTQTHCASIQILYLLPQISSHIPWVSLFCQLYLLTHSSACAQGMLSLKPHTGTSLMGIRSDFAPVLSIG